jgi:hypothetical protein
MRAGATVAAVDLRRLGLSPVPARITTSMPRPADGVTQSIRVFIASPGGVDDERKAVREIAGEFNVPLERHGWRVETLGWEDRGPASGRPQAEINPDIKRCDVFVGILTNRWGSSTGTHSSGFAEEWNLASERYKQTGAPELWLYFRDPAVGAAESEEQLDRVEAFRRDVEVERIAFYKSYADPEEFERLLRPRLLEEVFKRSGLTRTDLGSIALDWSAAYDREPISLLVDGTERLACADELLSSSPGKAAELFIELGEEADQSGFADEAESMRVRACRALLDSQDTQAAVGLLRTILGSQLWLLQFERLDDLLRLLQADLPPEFETELQAWRACSNAPNDPAAAIDSLTRALEQDHAFELDRETVAQWRLTLWRCLLHEGRPEKILSEHPGEVEPDRNETILELALLHAEARRAANDAGAEGAWAKLRGFAISEAADSPSTTARISTRHALNLCGQERFGEAQSAYADAATRWTRVDGGHELAAAAFFSAQIADQLENLWGSRGWAWRGVAREQRSGRPSFLRRAEEDVSEGMRHLVKGEPREAIRLLVTALWAYQREGLLQGNFRARSLLAEALAAEGDDLAATKLLCHIRDVKKAKQVAFKSTRRPAICEALSGDWPGWTREPRYEVLGAIGRSAIPEVAARLVRELLPAIKEPERGADNVPGAAAGALAALAVALEDRETLDLAVARLTDLAREQRYYLAQPSRQGLRMLVDVGKVSDPADLIAGFAVNRGPDEPNPRWVADHLTTETVPVVKQAALGGHEGALLALIEADRVAEDPTLREYCRRIAQGAVGSDLGFATDGAIHGLMDLAGLGAIAAASEDEGLQHALAESLLLYAVESRWPMVNRVAAVNGVWALRKALDSKEWLEELRPLASPEQDLDEGGSDPWNRMWTEPGDLEAAALGVCADFWDKGASAGWLDDLLEEAATDERTSMREAAWMAARRHSRWFDPVGARHAMVDSSCRVRSKAVQAWSAHGDKSLSTSTLSRLATDQDTGVRLALISVMECQSDGETIATLMADQDAYVRGVARRRLRPV